MCYIEQMNEASSTTLSDPEANVFSRRLTQRVPGFLVDRFFSTLSVIGKRTPPAVKRLKALEKTSDLSYGPNGKWNTLDTYKLPSEQKKRPVVLYVHGGAFRALSKDTHWLMAQRFAHRGFVVVNINYRLAPQHPYPAAMEDTCLAWEWVIQHIESYGGDPDNILVAGESAGANLIMGLIVACCYPRSETWAQRVYNIGQVPIAALPACGVYQVSNPERFLSSGFSSRLVYANASDMADCYLPTETLRKNPELADPVCIIEQQEPHRQLPTAFLPVGTWDPLMSDNRRLSNALRARGVSVVEREYERGVHAFHALIFLPLAQVCWREMLHFAHRVST